MTSPKTMIVGKLYVLSCLSDRLLRTQNGPNGPGFGYNGQMKNGSLFMVLELGDPDNSPPGWTDSKVLTENGQVGWVTLYETNYHLDAAQG